MFIEFTFPDGQKILLNSNAIESVCGSNIAISSKPDVIYGVKESYEEIAKMLLFVDRPLFMMKGAEDDERHKS